MSTTVSFYGNHNFKDFIASYTGPQAQPDPGISYIDSLKVGPNTWLIAYQQHNYGGDALKVGPNSSHSDLHKVSRGSGNWKNQISSFVVYDHQPSFWNSSNQPKLDLQVGTLIFAEDGDFAGDARVYSGNHQQGDLNEVNYTSVRDSESARDMKNNITSLATGQNQWLDVFDDLNFSGNRLKVPPNTAHKDLQDVRRGDNDDWKNQIQSFRCFDATSEPGPWSLDLSQSYFDEQYPNYWEDDKLAGDAIDYQTQDASYRIYQPVLSFPSNGMVAEIEINHIVAASTDDTSNLTLTFNADKQLTQVQQDWQAGSAFEVPPWLIKVVDAAVEMEGVLAMLATAGISEEAAQDFVAIFDAACNTFNKICSVIANISESDGGRFYMIPVSCHTIARACLAVTQGQPQGDSALSVDYNRATGMLQGSGWQQAPATNGNLNKKTEYHYQGHACRTWYYEVTQMRQGAGMLVSCKVDLEVSSEYDDHLVLMMGFVASDAGPVPMFAQATVQCLANKDAANPNVIGQPVYSTQASPVSDFGQAIADSLSQVYDQDFGSDNANMRSLPALAQFNVNAMIAAVTGN